MEIILYKKKTGTSNDYCFKVDEERSRIIPGNLKNPLEKLAFMLKYFYKENKNQINITTKNLEENKYKFSKKEYTTFMKYLEKP